jgi:hypothetical protein
MDLTQPKRRSKRLSAAIGLALGAALLATTALPALAGDDEDVPLDTKIIREFLQQLGLQRGGPDIDYHERSPLVIPPNSELPPPERANTVANNPNWPKDPDLARAKAEAKARNRNTTEEIEREMNPLRPDQLSKPYRGPKPRGVVTGDNSTEHRGSILSAKELGYKGGLFGKMFGGDDAESARFTGEPPRTSLTEPPPGYQTPSPTQPYGVGKDLTPPKPTDYLTSHGTGTEY